ncbi:ExbD/TolR family protein [Polycyclovorans algicola]|uniref:ExbD/TolR family protein n=1 Tax=Polycyclovorans algicola TaxID=616992 RepID=UPI000694210A|nr:biopolymer transporter ExbD [Polycyclovorans algicola]
MHVPFARRRPIPSPLTSLIDVVFILLFFFMLASSYMDWRSLTLSLGGPADAASAQSRDAWAVQVYADGGLALNGTPLSAEDIDAQLREMPGFPVVVQPEPGVSLQALVTVLDRLRPTGVSLVVGRLPQ